ncbi:hypothetical protein KI387_016197 [Taxus chinensis]|uniref:GDSL esterase/lipase n=1 Tax=Taxus chinensis TaxID=29808 RepID=A0AA38LE40_TAXCH|nr:hypothetical protein KI387_016197 [Taxus chinensis]
MIEISTDQISWSTKHGSEWPLHVSTKAALGAESVLPYLDPSINGDALLRGANFASAGVGILNDTGVQFANIIRIPQQFAYFEEYQRRVAQILGEAETERLVEEALVSSITLGGNDYVNNYYLLPVSLRSVQFTVPDYTEYIVSEYEKYLRVKFLLFS